jgi:nucleoside-diphosphate-sugar epimerase
VIHLAFKHDIAFSGDFAGAATSDRAAVEVMCEALKGSGRPFVLASGLLGIAPGRVATERDGLTPDPDQEGYPVGPAARLATAQRVIALAEDGIRTSVMRLSPTNHGEGDNGFMATLVNIARETGVSGYLGDGSSRWPAVHQLDSATLFRLAVESAPAGSALHAAADEGVPLREIAETIGKQLDIPVRSISAEDAPEHFTWLAHFIGLDSPASSTITRELLGWEPVQPGLIADLELDHYYSR